MKGMIHVMPPEESNVTENNINDNKKKMKLVTLDNLKYFWDPESAIVERNNKDTNNSSND